MVTLWLDSPMCDAVTKAGVKEVFIGIQAPCYKVSGRGIEYLKKTVKK
jgi:pyrimidine deaminase RibD-like protein